MEMIHVYIGEERGGRIKFTTDQDCLSPEIIRFDERVFPGQSEVGDLNATLMHVAHDYESRGFQVCIDTEELFYETQN